MKIGHCKDCKFWGGTPTTKIQCECFKNGESEESDGVWIEYDIPPADFTCGPDFGCIHFKPEQ